MSSGCYYCITSLFIISSDSYFQSDKVSALSDFVFHRLLDASSYSLFIIMIVYVCALRLEYYEPIHNLHLTLPCICYDVSMWLLIGLFGFLLCVLVKT